MGGFVTKPAAAKNIFEPPYPGSLGIDGLSIGTSEECDSDENGDIKCRLGVVPGISVSTAKLTRVFGPVTDEQCGSLLRDWGRLYFDKKISVGEFKNNWRAGKYYRDDGNGDCTQVLLSDEGYKWMGVDLKNIGDAINGGWYETGQVRKKTANTGASYSRDTKLEITPSIPFKIMVNGDPIEVKNLRLYHPSPIRIENVQHDAVLSLNDPSDPDTRVVVLIPIVGSVMAGESGKFLSRIVSFIPGMLSVNKTTGLFPRIDATTGADWKLTKILPTEPTPCGETLVTGGFFAWHGMPDDMTMTETINPLAWNEVNAGETLMRMFGNFESWKQSVFNKYPTIKTYTPTGKLAPVYIMMEKPILVNSFDLQTIRKLPVTPPAEAIHKIPMRFVYKPGPPTGCSAPKTGASMYSKEKFDVEEPDKCDPFAYKPSKSAITTETIINVLLGFFAAAAVVIGVYFGLKWATGPTGELFRKVGEKVGKMVSSGNMILKRTGVPAAAAAVASAPKAAVEAVSESINPMIQDKKPATKPRQVADFKTRRSLATYKSPAARKLTQRAKKPEQLTPAEEKKVMEEYKTLGTEELTPAEEKNVMEEYKTLGTEQLTPAEERQALAELEREASPAGTGLFTEAELKAAQEAQPTPPTEPKKRNIKTEEQENAEYDTRIAAEEKKVKEAADALDAEAEKVDTKADEVIAKVEDKAADQVEKIDTSNARKERIEAAKKNVEAILAKTKRDVAEGRKKSAAALERSRTMRAKMREVIPGESPADRERRFRKIARDLEEAKSRLVLTNRELASKQFPSFPTPPPAVTLPPREKSATVGSPKAASPPSAVKPKSTAVDTRRRSGPASPPDVPKRSSRQAWQG